MLLRDDPGLRSWVPKPPGQDPRRPSGPGTAPPVRKAGEAVLVCRGRGSRPRPLMRVLRPPPGFSASPAASGMVASSSALLEFSGWHGRGEREGGEVYPGAAHGTDLGQLKLLEPRGVPAFHRAVAERGGVAGTVGKGCSGAVAWGVQEGRVRLPGGWSSGRSAHPRVGLQPLRWNRQGRTEPARSVADVGHRLCHPLAGLGCPPR